MQNSGYPLHGWVFVGLAAEDVLEAAPLPDPEAVPPPKYVTDALVDVLEVMVPLLLLVDDAAAEFVPERRVDDDKPDDSVIVVVKD